MNRVHSILGVLFIIASLLGMYAQRIAYFLNENYLNLTPFTYLLMCTIASMVIYIVIYVVVFLQARKNQLTRPLGTAYIFGLFIALLISFWSIFVLMMWWG